MMKFFLFIIGNNIIFNYYNSIIIEIHSNRLIISYNYYWCCCVAHIFFQFLGELGDYDPREHTGNYLEGMVFGPNQVLNTNCFFYIDYKVRCLLLFVVVLAIAKQYYKRLISCLGG